MSATTSEPAFAAALADTVRRVVPGAETIGLLARLSGGASQETWALRAFGPGIDRALVLRRQPDTIETGDKLPLASEAALMRAAAAVGVPSPPVVHVLSETDGVGAGFIMDHVEGETIARKILRDAAYAAARPKIARQAGEIIARIHTLDTTSLPPLRTVPPLAELDELTETYRRDGQPRPVFALAFRWLRDHAPATTHAFTVVHGDFRTGNLIVGPDGIRAVLDWELACVGDPVRDLGWFCTNSWRFGEIDKPAGGFGPRQDLLDGYAAVSGRRVTLDELFYWEVFGSLRWGVICLGMRARAAGRDRPLERAMIARRASETELDLLRLLLPRKT